MISAAERKEGTRQLEFGDPPLRGSTSRYFCLDEAAGFSDGNSGYAGKCGREDVRRYLGGLGLGVQKLVGPRDSSS